MFVGSPGTLSSGGDTLVGRVMPKGGYAELIRARTGDTIKLSLQLYNPAYGRAQGVHVRLKAIEEETGCWRLTGLASSAIQPDLSASFGPMLILTPISAPASRLQYVRSSTRLIDQHSTLIGALRDGAFESGISIPFEIPPGADDVYYLELLMRLRK